MTVGIPFLGYKYLNGIAFPEIDTDKIEEDKEKNAELYLKNLRKTIGAQIKSARKEKGWSQSELAKACHLAEESRTTIAKWESGSATPNYSQLEDLCRAFSCEMTYLLGDHLKTRDEQFVQDYTGLSAQSIVNLRALKLLTSESDSRLLNTILESEMFWTALREFRNCILVGRQLNYDMANPLDDRGVFSEDHWPRILYLSAQKYFEAAFLNICTQEMKK